MPYRPRMLRNRRDELSPTDQLELPIGGPDPALEAMWQRHGAQLMRADASGERFSWPRDCYGAPPGWTHQDERVRAARQAETEAGRRRSSAQREQRRRHEAAPTGTSKGHSASAAPRLSRGIGATGFRRVFPDAGTGAEQETQ